MYYEMPVSIGDPVAWLQWINYLCGYWFGPVIVIGVFLMLFLGGKAMKYGTEKVYAAASINSAILCFLLMLLELTTVSHLMLASIAAMSSLFMLERTRGSE